MANSALRFNQYARFIQDQKLGHLLSIISENISAKLESGNLTYSWLGCIVESWWDDYLNSPPGLRDIELDDVLRDRKQVEFFQKFLEELLLNSIEEGSKEEIKKLMEVIDKGSQL